LLSGICPDRTQCRQGSLDGPPDATRCGAWARDAHDVQDAESRLVESGCNTTVSDAGHLLADGTHIVWRIGTPAAQHPFL